jgi:primosomal protein N' (replication factor Y)
MAAPLRIYQVAVPIPLYGFFDYLALSHAPSMLPGARVRVPFGKREMIGVVLGEMDKSTLALSRLKHILQVIDDEPVLPANLLQLLTWVAEYYHHPIGEVLHAALPTLLRQGRVAEAGVAVWSLTPAGRAVEAKSLSRAPAQKHLLESLSSAPEGLDAEQMAQVSARWSAALKALHTKGWVSKHIRDCLLVAKAVQSEPPELNPGQRSAVEKIQSGYDGFHAYLLHGVTGSGKTEVYLAAIDKVLAQGRQALVLVPEIGLTPQVINRFQQRFRVPIAVLHSGLSDQERLCAWLMARDGKAPIVLGTRSAVLAPIKDLGLIVVDEEHDGSYKQQDGLRYSARDVAVMRASREKIPIVLGSATPSLESLKNAHDGTYALLHLPDRTGSAVMPQVRLLDMRRLKPSEGLSLPLREAVTARLEKGEQSLLFLNRRGFAPVWMCYDCGWLAPCRRCDAQLTLHQRRQKLICHHCGSEQEIVKTCPTCHGANLHPIGEGTERVEGALQKFFPTARIERIDRDSTRGKGMLEEKLRRVHDGEADILIGTQMLSKGHDFPNVTLVGILNADQGLYGVDFRSGERLFQTILQVSGRSGRADKPGEVLIQTWHPEHAIFTALQRHDFTGFADYALTERRDTGFPPFSFLALLRAESPQPQAAQQFLAAAHAAALKRRNDPAVQVFMPVAAPMERRAGRFRAQLLVQASKRAALHRLLGPWLVDLAELKAGKRVRWSVDVDPVDLY